MIISQVGSFSFQLHLPKTTHKCRKCDFPDQSDFPLLCRDMSLKPLYLQSIFNVNNAIGGQLECMKESTFIRESWIQVRTFCETSFYFAPRFFFFFPFSFSFCLFYFSRPNLSRWYRDPLQPIPRLFVGNTSCKNFPLSRNELLNTRCSRFFINFAISVKIITK